MTTPQKPMLAVDAPTKISFPMLASPKLDGIRCTVWGGEAFSRSLKPIPNAFVTETIRAAALPYVLDGELVVGPAQAKDVYRRTVSGVMSRDGEPDFTFWVFDIVRQGETAAHRQARSPGIKAADLRMLVTEARMLGMPLEFFPVAEPYEELRDMLPWPAEIARQRFLHQFDMLNGRY